MAKILLVEDDKSLREIYGVRLMAEGYEIVSAGDGEEALAMAIKERPDLIVSDVMMPKISGFDMLDILRSTSETKDVKVIMMTALSSDDQRARGEALGADRYLVKSQVGIEDVVRTVHDVLGDNIAPTPAAVPTFGPGNTPVGPAPAATPFQSQSVATSAAPIVPGPLVAPAEPIAAPTPAPVAEPVFVPQPITAPAPVAQEPVFTPAPAPVAPAPQVFEPAAAPVVEPFSQPIPPVPVAAPAPTFEPTPASTTLSELPANPIPAPIAEPVAAPVFEPLPQPTAPFSTPAPASLGERVIQPLTGPVAEAPVLDIASQIAQELNPTLPQDQTIPPTPPTV